MKFILLTLVFVISSAAQYVPPGGTGGGGGSTWSTLPGKPATFTPATHAASHQNGGADAVATVTPAANVIPQAGAGGKLAIGFIASGTPDGTKFVRDDGTLVTPSGGGTPGGSANTIQYNSAGSFGGFVMSGDCTLVVATGVISCTPASTTSALALKAPLASPTFTGTVTLPGGATVDSSGNISTPGSVSSMVGSGVATALDFQQGTAPATQAANTFRLRAPASVPTAFSWTAPSADAAGAIVSDGSGNLSLVGSTGTGNFVRATSPTLVTPVLGTPTSATLTNATGLPLTTGVTGLLPHANIASTAVTPGAYTSANITVAADGSITAAANGTGGGGGGGAAVNPACTFATTATGCTINVAGLAVATANSTSILAECFTIVTGTQTSVAATYTITTGSGIVQTVVPLFSAAAAGGYCTANLTSGGVNSVFGQTGTVGAVGDIGATGTVIANAITSAKMAAVNTRRTCLILIGADNGAALATADIAPQGRQCFVPAAAHIIEITIAADAGTPAVVVAKNSAGTLTSLNASLATAASGGLACVNVAGSGTAIDGVTTCALALLNTTLAAGDWIETRTSASASTAKRVSIAVTYTVD